MSQRIRSTLILLAAILLVLGSPFARAQSANTSTSRPNFIFIMADDHGKQATSCYGGSFIKTPNIDRLARDGLRFNHAMAGNSICSPSRAMLLTGKYNHLCGVERLEAHFDGTQQTFPKLLQKAGYETAIVGKWHLFSEPTGFDYYCVAPGNGGRYYDPLLKDKSQPWIDGNSGGTLHKGYMTDVLTDVALDWLKHRPADKPFCLMLHHKAPHGPFDVAPRHKKLFEDTLFAEPPTLLDDYRGRAPEPVADVIPWSRLLTSDLGEFRDLKKQYTGDRGHDTRLAYQAYMKGYLRLVATLDEDIGRVLDYIDRSGLRLNTVVIYTSDNGFFLGEHGFYNKMWMYEEGFHIPLLIRQPGGTAGATCDRMVSILDLAPTLLDLAGVTVPADMQGRSMQPLLRHPSAPWRSEFYYHYYGMVGRPSDKNWIAYHEIVGVRTEAAKLIYYPTWKGGPFWECFDLGKDPNEMRNLCNEPSQEAKVADLKGRLRALAVQYRDTKMIESIDHDRRSVLLRTTK